jgi:MFS family permease
MACSYLFQFLDKSALSYTAILGIREDLHLSGSDFSWASAIYYFGYLAASYPAGFLMVRLLVGKMIATSVYATRHLMALPSFDSNKSI